METALIIWAIGTLPSIGVAFTIIGITGSVGTLLVTLVLLAEGYIDSIKMPMFVVILFAIMALFGAIIPDKQTAYAMAAGAVGQKIVESPKAQELGSDAVDVLSAYLKKTKKELEEENK